MTKKPSTYVVKDDGAFKQANLTNWYENSSFWLEGKMRHLRDVAIFTRDELSQLLALAQKSQTLPSLFDFGCGNGWIYRLVESNHLAARYVGIDFNDRFIADLN